MTLTEDLTLLLEVRSTVYGLLSQIYLTPLSEGLLTAMNAPAFVQEWPLGRGSADVDAGLTRLTEVLPQVAAVSLRHEFWSLFGALGSAAAPPWQSVYLDRENVPFGEQTERVRALFARYGLVFTETKRHPEDHIGLHLEFLSRLSAQTVSLLTAGDEAGARALLAGQQSCLEEHLMRWVPQFVRRVEAASDSGFYGAVARLTLGCLRTDREALGQLV